VTSRKGIEVIRLAHLDGEINVLYGAAGLGKTMILREYASRHRDALLIEADPGYTARVVLEELVDCLASANAATCMNSAKPALLPCVIQVAS
jgi:DNA transposition AAA+ family ATPase